MSCYYIFVSKAGLDKMYRSSGRGLTTTKRKRREGNMKVVNWAVKALAVVMAAMVLSAGAIAEGDHAHIGELAALTA